jgi:hypothetical protein
MVRAFTDSEDHDSMGYDAVQTGILVPIRPSYKALHPDTSY